jgi:hypothetical protein
VASIFSGDCHDQRRGCAATGRRCCITSPVSPWRHLWRHPQRGFSGDARGKYSGRRCPRQVLRPAMVLSRERSGGRVKREDVGQRHVLCVP